MPKKFRQLQIRTKSTVPYIQTKNKVKMGCGAL
jgi:hypothetical protein